MAFDPIRYKRVERETYSLTAESYDRYGAKFFESYAVPLLAVAGLEPGQKVLDIACGTGIPSLGASRIVAPGGTVIGIDLAPGMLTVARRKAGERRLANIDFREADAEELPFGNESFDVVLCSHGLVHMPDRARALREMRRVLKKSGILAVSTWSAPDRSLALGIVAKTVRELWPAAIAPGAPMWFDFGPEGALERTLSEAGFLDVETKRHALEMETGSPEEYWDAVVGVSGRLQMLLKSVPQDVASDIKQNIMKASEHFRVEGQIRIPCEEIVARARR